MPVVAPVAILDTDLEKQVKALNLPELPTCVSANIGFAQRRYDANRFLYIVDLSFSNPSSSCDQVNKVTITDQNIDPEYCNSNHIDKIEVNGVSSVEYLPSYENNRAGNYRMSVIFEMKNGKTYTETIEHQVLARGAEAFKNEIEVNYLEPLKPTADPFSSPHPNLVSSNNIGFHIKNTTGAYLDITLIAAKNEYTNAEKDKIFFGKCLSISEGDLLFDRKNLPTDDYVLSVKMSESDYFTVRIPFRVENIGVTASTFFTIFETNEDRYYPDRLRNGVQFSLNKISDSIFSIVPPFDLETFSLHPFAVEEYSIFGETPLNGSNLQNIQNCFSKNVISSIYSDYSSNYLDTSDLFIIGTKRNRTFIEQSVYTFKNSIKKYVNSINNESFNNSITENCSNTKKISVGSIIDLSNTHINTFNDGVYLGEKVDFDIVLKSIVNGNEKDEVFRKTVTLDVGRVNFLTISFNDFERYNPSIILTPHKLTHFEGKLIAKIEPKEDSSKFFIKYSNSKNATIDLIKCSNEIDKAIDLNQDISALFSTAIPSIFIINRILFFITNRFYNDGFKGIDCNKSIDEIGLDNTIQCDKLYGKSKNEYVQEKETKYVNQLPVPQDNCQQNTDTKIVSNDIQKTSMAMNNIGSNFSNFIQNFNQFNYLKTNLTNKNLDPIKVLKDGHFLVKSNTSIEDNIKYNLNKIFIENNDLFKEIRDDNWYIENKVNSIKTFLQNKGINIDFVDITNKDLNTLIDSLSLEFNNSKQTYSIDDSLKAFLRELNVYNQFSTKYIADTSPTIEQLNNLEKLKANIKTHQTYISSHFILKDSLYDNDYKQNLNTFLDSSILSLKKSFESIKKVNEKKGFSIKSGTTSSIVLPNIPATTPEVIAYSEAQLRELESKLPEIYRQLEFYKSATNENTRASIKANIQNLLAQNPILYNFILVWSPYLLVTLEAPLVLIGGIAFVTLIPYFCDLTPNEKTQLELKSSDVSNSFKNINKNFTVTYTELIEEKNKLLVKLEECNDITAVKESINEIDLKLSTLFRKYHDVYQSIDGFLKSLIDKSAKKTPVSEIINLIDQKLSLINNFVNTVLPLYQGAAQKIAQKIDDICSCTKSDFDPKTGQTPPDSVIKCRIYNYKDDNGKIQKRDIFTANNIINYMDKINNARVEYKRLFPLINNIDPDQARTFAVAEYTDTFSTNSNNSTLYALNRNDIDETPPKGSSSFNWAEMPKVLLDRFYVGKTLSGLYYPVLGRNGTDGEVKIIESIASKRCGDPQRNFLISDFSLKIGNKFFNQYSCTGTTITLFTDRETCGFCKSTFSDDESKGIIKGVTPNLSIYSINANMEGKKKGIFYLGEFVSIKPNNWYSMNMR